MCFWAVLVKTSSNESTYGGHKALHEIYLAAVLFGAAVDGGGEGSASFTCAHASQVLRNGVIAVDNGTIQGSPLAPALPCEGGGHAIAALKGGMKMHAQLTQE